MFRSIRWIIVLGFPAGLANADTPEKIEFFESRIRPILAQECYECHSEETKDKGGLYLDTRAGWEVGGDSGEPVIVPGKPEESLLLKSIAHDIDDLQMPKAGAKLEESVLADFWKWIADGAVDPRTAPPTNAELVADTDWSAIRERRKGWWSFQPIVRNEAPAVKGTEHPVDRFIRHRLEQVQLPASPRADARSLHRRINFTLIGLPPTIEESKLFLEVWNRDPDRAVEELVDALLEDQRFGEKWARHWMDWLRYADSHGSEGDPVIPHAWRYRDYLIRAFNSDVPYDQLVTEHIAGDLLAHPRISEDLGLNESAIGPAHFRMVFHGFSPTDALDERIRFTDDQINVVTKAFMGLTVSCARCHDHKFDAISQADYYAIYGAFTSAFPATVAADAPGVLETGSKEMADLKPNLRSAIGDLWLETIEAGNLNWKAGEEALTPTPAIEMLVNLSKAEDVAATWASASANYQGDRKRFEEIRNSDALRMRWDLGESVELSTWTRMGEGLLEEKVSPAGTFAPGVDGQLVKGIYPAGVYSNKFTEKHRALLASAPFDLDGEYDLYLNVIGENALSRFVVQHYPRRGTVFPTQSLDNGKWLWARFNKLDYWNGDNIHIELSTAGETAVLVRPGERSWFGIREALLIKKGGQAPPSRSLESLGPIFEGAGDIESVESARVRYKEVLQSIVMRWGKGEALTDAEALLLDEVVQVGLLPNQLDNVGGDLADLVDDYRAQEKLVPLPTRVPGIVERAGKDHPLYIRGDHKQPGEIIPRRFLEVIDETPYESAGSGRLEFASDLLREDNPFTSRMIVNRIWHHLFGAGLVASADNFGRLGEAPSHPELLDFMADRFRREQAWSVKELIRDLMLTTTWQQASLPSDAAREKDPDNRFLSHYSMRRLEAEAIRDSVHFVSGRLDEQRYGEPVSGNSPRRAIYLRTKRNSLDPFMTTFDFPVAASTVGRRDATNVPAQSLTMLNDPYLIQQAAGWAGVISKRLPADAADEAMIREFFLTGLNREPTEREMSQSFAFLSAVDVEYRETRQRLSGIRDQLSRLTAEMQDLEAPVRERLLAERSSGDSIPAVDLKPVAHWDFANGLMDQIAGMSARAHGTARIEEQALVLDGEGFLSAGPLRQDFAEKSLEVRVQLDDTTQRGGGVMTVQDLRGSHFDSIVFAERKPGQWLVGSNHHHRTLDLGATSDSSADSSAVHLVATFREDGTIRFYRNGEPWGKPTRKADLYPFKAGEAEVVFGLRHGTRVDARRALKGRVFQASLYDRALTPKEVAAAYGQGKSFISEGDVVAGLSEAQRNERERLKARTKKLESERDELLGEESGILLQHQRWQEFAHAMFNLKEFIYLR